MGEISYESEWDVSNPGKVFNLPLTCGAHLTDRAVQVLIGFSDEKFSTKSSRFPWDGGSFLNVLLMPFENRKKIGTDRSLCQALILT